MDLDFSPVFFFLASSHREIDSSGPQVNYDIPPLVSATNKTNIHWGKYHSIYGHWCWQDAYRMARRSSCQNRSCELQPLPVRLNSGHVGHGRHDPRHSWSSDFRGTRTRKQESPYSSSVDTWAAASCRTWRTCLAHLESLPSPLKQHTMHKRKNFKNVRRTADENNFIG